MNNAAIYIRKETALLDGIRLAKSHGVREDTILRMTKAKPVYTRGALQGWRCVYPVSETSVKHVVEV
jgi:hypothetical protein